MIKKLFHAKGADYNPEPNPPPETNFRLSQDERNETAAKKIVGAMKHRVVFS